MNGRAFFHVQQGDLDDPVRRNFLAQYDVLILNAAIDHDEMREVNPTATLLVYVCSHFIPNYGEGLIQFDAMRAVAEGHYLMADGAKVLAPKDALDGTFNAWEMQPTLEWAERFAQAMPRIWAPYMDDANAGIYVDECQGERPPWWLSRMGYSISDFVRELTISRYQRFIDHLLTCMRISMPGRKIIANTNGYSRLDAVLPPETVERLDGISIEHPKIQDLYFFRECSERMSSQGRGGLNIGWYSAMSAPGVVRPGDILE